MRFLITGSAGFIGFHLSRRLLADGHDVVGFDALTNYYDPALKRERHRILGESPRFSAVTARLEDREELFAAGEAAGPDVIVHLAAQAGVRYSIENPDSYVSSNLVGSFNVLELARAVRPRHLLLASTSSVYGANEKSPFEEGDKADFPMNIYSASKKAMESMAHAYAHLWDLPTTCFRFFTVYGPWGRPDMALFQFVDAITSGQPIRVFGNGEMRRDFTFIDDLVEAIVRLTDRVPTPESRIAVPGVTDTLSPVAPWRVVNIGGGNPVPLMDFIMAIEHALDRRATKIMLPMQPGDVRETFADHALLEALTGFRPATPIDVGVQAFVDWYLRYRVSVPEIVGA
jgi:UDP-glucuronate 4-epimerase